MKKHFANAWIHAIIEPLSSLGYMVQVPFRFKFVRKQGNHARGLKADSRQNKPKKWRESNHVRRHKTLVCRDCLAKNLCSARLERQRSFADKGFQNDPTPVAMSAAPTHAATLRSPSATRRRSDLRWLRRCTHPVSSLQPKRDFACTTPSASRGATATQRTEIEKSASALAGVLYTIKTETGPAAESRRAGCGMSRYSHNKMRPA